MNMKERPSADFIELLKRSGSSDKAVAIEAQREIAKALELPLRKGVLFGDVVTSIYEAMPLEPGATPEFHSTFLLRVQKAITLLTLIRVTVVFQNVASKAITSWLTLTELPARLTSC